MVVAIGTGVLAMAPAALASKPAYRATVQGHGAAVRSVFQEPNALGHEPVKVCFQWQGRNDCQAEGHTSDGPTFTAIETTWGLQRVVVFKWYIGGKLVASNAPYKVR